MSLILERVSLNEAELKSILTELKHEKVLWTETDHLLILRSMINHIGSTDHELRDRLIYPTFYKLIIENNQLEPELLKELLDISLEKLLFFGIGEEESDTVFTRAFTTLLIALILYRDNEANFLTPMNIDTVKEKLIAYIEQEKDIRGYIPVKGWAHSIAHVADAVDELVKNPKLDKAYYPELLKALWNKIFVSSSVYVHGEDDRVLNPIVEMLDRGLDVHIIEEYIEGIPNQLKVKKEQLDPENYWFLESNRNIFLKSFYIKILEKSELKFLREKIKEGIVPL